MKHLLFVWAFFATASVFAQKQVDHRQQVWLGYFDQIRLTDRSGVWVDLQLRLNEFVEQKSVSILRTGYTYYVSDQFRLTAGYGYITSYALSTALPDVPEQRLWQQAQWFDRKKRLSLAQYFRVEQRFVRRVADGELDDESLFSWRFRYNFAASVPLKGDAVVAKTPFLFLNDEILVNAGKNIVNNYFDQNRFMAGLGYQFASNMNAIVGYLHVFQQLPAGDRYVNVDGVRVMVFHNLDLRRNRLR